MYPHCTHIFSAAPTPYPHPQKRNEPQEAEASQDSTTIKILPHGKNLPANIPNFSSIQVFKLYLHRDSVGCTKHTATMRILIDNGHGQFTPGKRSPDGQLREAFYTREIARRITSRLQKDGLDAQLLTPDSDDVPLKERCARVNRHCLLLGKDNVILISIHCNAAACDGQWHAARGWSVYTSKGKTTADQLATCLANAALKSLEGHRIRSDWSDGDVDIEADFYLLRHTLCASALTENLFMDNLQDKTFLESSQGKDAIVNLHVEGIKAFLEL